MKKIFCELCDGTEFKKENGMFVCQGCGTSYSVEEARGMMREVEGDAPVSTSAPVASIPAESPNQAQIDNLLVLASNAYESSNCQEAEGYCNKVIELDVTCYKAWLLKGQAIGWQSTYGKPRVSEGANAMHKAVDFAPEDEKEDVAKQAIDAISNICTALCSLAKENFGNNPTKTNRDKFVEFDELCANAIDLFNNVSEDVRQFGNDEYVGFKKKLLAQMNLAGVAAVNTVREKWNDLDHPNENSWRTYLDWYGEIVVIFSISIHFGKEFGEDEEELITRYKNLIIATEDPIGSCSWTREWNSYVSEYRWQKEYTLTDEAVAHRRKEIQKYKEEIAKLERKAEEEKQARIDAYWEAHADEKKALDDERERLGSEVKEIDAKISKCDFQINAIKSERNKMKAPSEAEIDKLRDQIKDLENKRAGLGMFAGKEKKKIGEEIAALKGRIDSLSEKVNEEKRAIGKDYQTRIDPLQKQKDELSSDRNTKQKRINAIDSELSKDPEE
ncbi:hypothetical protein [Ruminococcus sp.]|uniref:hypothetical protein n=1 Tax=Ruminococcus sp. TaxID=41978 RepID=UPI002E822BA3|nr:hypothetical protein [Ruminococcus sp.]MEE3491537.1 hypothetical protein [Ruminococcus sp.]